MMIRLAGAPAPRRSGEPGARHSDATALRRHLWLLDELVQDLESEVFAGTAITPAALHSRLLALVRPCGVTPSEAPASPVEALDAAFEAQRVVLERKRGVIDPEADELTA